MINRKQSAVVIALVLVLFPPRPLDALSFTFSKKKPNSNANLDEEKPRIPSPDILSYENGKFRILFSRTGNKEERRNAAGKPETWSEINYKFSSLVEDAAQLFPDSKWNELVFKDAKGEMLAKDQFSLDKLEAGQRYYAYLWIKDGDISKIQSVALKGIETPPPSDPQSNVPSTAFTVEKNQPADAQEKNAVTPTGEKDKIPEQSVDNHIDNRITNDTVQETLKQFEHQIPTFIAQPEAPPSSDSEDGGAAPAANPPQGEDKPEVTKSFE